MNTNSTDQSVACQAERPEYLSVQHNGQEFRLTWEAGKQKYRLHLRHLPRLRDTYYGPDPADAAQGASERLPSLLALVASRPTPKEVKPKHLLLTHKGIEYRLTLHKSGEYRRKFNRQDKYFGATAETARDDFYARIDGILAGKDPRFSFADDEPLDSSDPSFTFMVEDGLAY